MEFLAALLALLAQIEISNAWLALIGAILGGSGLKFMEHWLSRKDKADDAAVKFRDELRADREQYRNELRAVEAEHDALREKYAKLQEDFYTILLDNRTQEKKIDTIGRVVDRELPGDEVKKVLEELPSTPDPLP